MRVARLLRSTTNAPRVPLLNADTIILRARNTSPESFLEGWAAILKRWKTGVLGVVPATFISSRRSQLSRLPSFKS